MSDFPATQQLDLGQSLPLQETRLVRARIFRKMFRHHYSVEHLAVISMGSFTTPQDLVTGGLLEEHT